MQHLILEEEILVALQGNLDYFCRYLGSGSSPSYYFVGMSLVGIRDALILRNDSPTRATRVIISEMSFRNFSTRDLVSRIGKSIQQLKQSCTHQIFSLWTSLMVAKVGVYISKITESVTFFRTTLTGPVRPLG